MPLEAQLSNSQPQIKIPIVSLKRYRCYKVVITTTQKNQMIWSRCKAPNSEPWVYGFTTPLVRHEEPLEQPTPWKGTCNAATISKPLTKTR